MAPVSPVHQQQMRRYVVHIRFASLLVNQEVRGVLAHYWIMTINDLPGSLQKRPIMSGFIEPN
jgi:hypothetical protein